MIFNNFISGSRLQQPQESPGPLDGATSGPVGKLRRLVQVSASRLVGRQQQQQQQLRSETASSQQAEEEQTTGNRSTRASEWQLECKYTLSEVQQHSQLDDCWMVIFDKVYNITEFVYEHPGGDFILLEYAGRDATHPFLSSRHGSSAYKMLDKYWIGILVDEELYYSNNSSYCSVYSDLSWRSTPTLAEQQPSSGRSTETRVALNEPEITSQSTTTTDSTSAENLKEQKASTTTDTDKHQIMPLTSTTCIHRTAIPTRIITSNLSTTNDMHNSRSQRRQLFQPFFYQHRLSIDDETDHNYRADLDDHYLDEDEVDEQLDEDEEIIDDIDDDDDDEEDDDECVICRTGNNFRSS